MFAARAQNVEQVILPALDAGSMVLCDRFTDSTWAYQGIARGLGTDVVISLDRLVCRGLIPDLTLYLDIDPELGLSRVRSRKANAEESRLDDHALEFHLEVRQAFLDLAHREAGRIKVIDAAAEPHEVARQVWSYVAPCVG
jgi:dTMP kinase